LSRLHSYRPFAKFIQPGAESFPAPFGDVEDLVLAEAAKRYAVDRGLERKQDIFIKGALLAKDPRLLCKPDQPPCSDFLYRWQQLVRYCQLLGTNVEIAGDNAGKGMMTLTKEETEALQDENIRTGRPWRQSPKLTRAIFISSLAAMIQGWDQVAISASSAQLRPFLNLEGNDLNSCDRNSWYNFLDMLSYWRYLTSTI